MERRKKKRSVFFPHPPKHVLFISPASRDTKLGPREQTELAPIPRTA